MKSRGLLASTLFSLAVVVSSAAAAQGANMQRIGFVLATTPASTFRETLHGHAFLDGLRGLGYEEGRKNSSMLTETSRMIGPASSRPTSSRRVNTAIESSRSGRTRRLWLGLGLT
jgi:hypothetical protein